MLPIGIELRRAIEASAKFAPDHRGLFFGVVRRLGEE
jgi:hypothetical protein